MDRNQFPRRMCGFALCLLAVEVGIWQDSSGPLVDAGDTSTVVPSRHSAPVEMPAVQGASQVHPVIPADSSNSAERFGDR